MGHRALLAYRRETGDSTETTDESDAHYDLHRSHWGGADFALLDRLSAADPFATDAHFAVDPDPVATDVSLADAVTNHLDYLHHEAFYRVGADYETTAYHVLWFGLEADSETVARSETVGNGALVEARRDADYVRGWFRGTKAVVGDVVDRGEFSTEEAAANYLAERVETWATDREVILPT